jgi:RNA polymerase sigma-70 factor, ECF subfamily
LQPTALVNELYIRLFTGEPITWQNRAHFFGMAAKTLRLILVDHARRRSTEKRGGKQVKLSLTAANGWAKPCDEDILNLEDILRYLEELEPRAARVVELRFFGGLDEKEVAEVLGVSVITVKRDWKFARAWLMSQLGPFVEIQPTVGEVGSVVNILGTTLTGATSVSFSGNAAVFTVTSPSLITTSVPAGATTGKVQVVTPRRTLSSNISFRVLP